ncbi:hypothetical protein GCM10009133_29350 [Cocleimonas flava]
MTNIPINRSRVNGLFDVSPSASISSNRLFYVEAGNLTTTKEKVRRDKITGGRIGISGNKSGKYRIVFKQPN